MALHVHRAGRADHLVHALAEVLSAPLPDPMALDVVSVPARGIERWITQQLSHRLGRGAHDAGICAGVRFPSPAALVAEVVGARNADPWTPDRLVWPLLASIDSSMGRPWAETLTRHLGGATVAGGRRGRRYAVARRLAGLFDSYATYRPSMLRDWAAGDDTDGAGARLAADLGWQPHLWRLVRSRVAAPDPVQRMASALAALRLDPSVVALPGRLSVFGPSRLPVAQREVIDALATSREVHLWLPHPSAALWAAIAADPSMGTVRRRADRTAAAARHPLLASLGRESREMQLALRDPYVDHPIDPGPATPHLGATLLERLQADITADRSPSPAPVAADDRSVQVHACHGPVRQVEVLREVIVGLLQRDRTLEPRDVLVMCPDIEQYAPLIAAGFGLSEVVGQGHPAHGLRVRLADRALRQTNPLLAATLRLADLAGGRSTASEVLDLAAFPPVRRRFGFTDANLETISDWVVQSGVRWAADAEHRADFGLEGLPQNTWRTGIDRILLGVAMAEQDRNWMGLALPLDDVGSSEIELAGRLAEFLDRLTTATDRLTGEQSLAEWLARLLDAVESLTEVAGDDAWQRTELRRQLATIGADAGTDAESTVLGPSDVRAMLRARLAGRPTRSNFRTGTLTVCTMVPMRSVPHRVVCLLGLDDGVFPRGAGVDGDDILARDPVVGERDPRAEDRQLLLDAVMAATEHLVITYTGADDRTGARRPPSVPLGEVLGVLELSTGRPLGDPVLITHPLQPFDIAVVTPGALGVPGPFTFDPSALAAARAADGPRRAAAPFLARPLPPVDRPVIELADLVALLGNPARGFLRQRLDVSVPGEIDGPADSLAISLDNLEQWAVGDRLLRQRLAGVDRDTCRQVEWRRGSLPPGRLGAAALDPITEQVEDLVTATEELRAAPRRSVEVTLPLPGGRELHGTVPGVHGDRLVGVGYSRLGPRPRLASWIQLVALTLAHPNTEWSAVTVGRGRGDVVQAGLDPIARSVAAEIIGQLVDLYDRGLRAPLPLPVKTAEAYADARHGGAAVDFAEEQADRKWSTSNNFPGEGDDAANAAVWGPGAPLRVLLNDLPAADEWWSGESTRFGALACRLWNPVLDHERTDRW